MAFVVQSEITFALGSGLKVCFLDGARKRNKEWIFYPFIILTDFRKIINQKKWDRIRDPIYMILLGSYVADSKLV